MALEFKCVVGVVSVLIFAGCGGATPAPEAPASADESEQEEAGMGIGGHTNDPVDGPEEMSTDEPDSMPGDAPAVEGDDP